jgi:hypothetical protein
MADEPIKSENWYPSDTLCQIASFVGAVFADSGTLLREGLSAFYLGGLLVRWVFIAVLSLTFSFLISKKKHPVAHGWFFMALVILFSVLMYVIQHQKV